MQIYSDNGVEKGRINGEVENLSNELRSAHIAFFNNDQNGNLLNAISTLVGPLRPGEKRTFELDGVNYSEGKYVTLGDVELVQFRSYVDTSTPSPTAVLALTPTPVPTPTSVPTSVTSPTPTPIQPTPVPTPVPTPTAVPTTVPMAIPTPTAVPTPTPTPTAVPTPTPTPTPVPIPQIGLEVSSAFAGSMLGSDGSIEFEFVCWDITYRNPSNYPRTFKEILFLKDSNGISYPTGVNATQPLVPLEEYTYRRCELRGVPEFTELVVSIGEEVDWNNWVRWREYSGPEHLINPDLWDKYDTPSNILSVVSQPESVGVFYPGIPAADGNLWTITNTGEDDLFVELCMDKLWQNSGKSGGYSCQRKVVDSKTGAQFPYFEYEIPSHQSPTSQYLSRFIGIWSITTTQARENGILMKDVPGGQIRD